jgi:hypothetical protein
MWKKILMIAVSLVTPTGTASAMGPDWPWRARSTQAPNWRPPTGSAKPSLSRLGGLAR